jgi:hypothetical protein
VIITEYFDLKNASNIAIDFQFSSFRCIPPSTPSLLPLPVPLQWAIDCRALKCVKWIIANYPATLSTPFAPFPYALNLHMFVPQPQTMTSSQSSLVEALLDAHVAVDEHDSNRNGCRSLLMATFANNNSLIARIASHTAYINQPHVSKFAL